MEIQFTWDQLSDRGKFAVILGSRPTATKKEKGNNFDQPDHKVNLNETFNEDEEEFIDAKNMEGIVDDTEEALLIHSVIQRSHNGGTTLC